MSDESTTPDGGSGVDESTTPDGSFGADGSSGPGARPRPNPAASAASRARRIGGARTSAAPARTSRPSSEPVGESSPDAARSSGQLADTDHTGEPGGGIGEPVDTGESAVPARRRLTRKLSWRKGASIPPASAAESNDDTATPHDTAAPHDAAAPHDTAAPSESGTGPAVVTQVPAWLRWAPAAALAAAAVVMLVVLAITAHGVWYAKPSADSVRDRVLAAAKTCTVATNTYTYKTLAADEAKGVACSTGQWRSQYQQAVKSLVKPQATKLKASQSIQINNAGTETISSTGKQWTVVVYGQTRVTQAKTKARTDPFAAVVTMNDVAGKWLISHIGTVSTVGS